MLVGLNPQFHTRWKDISLLFDVEPLCSPRTFPFGQCKAEQGLLYHKITGTCTQSRLFIQTTWSCLDNETTKLLLAEACTHYSDRGLIKDRLLELLSDEEGGIQNEQFRKGPKKRKAEAFEGASLEKIKSLTLDKRLVPVTVMVDPGSNSSLFNKGIVRSLKHKKPLSGSPHRRGYRGQLNSVAFGAYENTN